MKAARTWVGVLSTLLVGSLLAIAAAAPRAVGGAPATTAALSHPACDLILQQSDGAEAFQLTPGAGVDQPASLVGNVAACSLTVDRIYCAGARLSLVQWDPTSLLPDPATVALRTFSFDCSAFAYNLLRADFVPPVVIRSLAHVAEPPRPTIAIDWRDDFTGQTLRFNGDGPAEIPAALQFPAGGGARSPLPGSHPVLSHAVCGGDADLQKLQIIQSVMTTVVSSDTGAFDLIQRFRVPARARLRWIEVAFGVAPHPTYFDPIMAILDATGQSEPPVTLPPSLVEAPFSQFVASPSWGSHFDFDSLITLEPEHDYWLLVRVEHRFVLFSRMLTGGESADFKASIGPSFIRTAPDAGWTANRGRAVCFRLIGEPLTSPHPQPRGRLDERPRGEATPEGRTPTRSATRVPADARETLSLRLTVAPNPSRGPAFVSWSGAAGLLRLDVLDAEGRRVAGSAHTEAGGRWLWGGARDDGRPLPAGVYLVRGTDGAGRIASERVVLIR